MAMATSSTQRLAIARELHDGIAQDLVGIGYSLDLLLAEPGLSNVVRSQLRTTRLHTDALIAKVRREIFDLRTHSSGTFTDSLTLIASKLLGEISVEIHSDEVPLEEDSATELLAIASEILRNISQHSRATHVDINLYNVNNRTCLEISDDGIGGAEMKNGHFGLQGIMERVEKIGGCATFDSKNGTKIAILL